MDITKESIIFHGTQEIVKEPEIRITKYNKDFYFGFYCTVLKQQAKRWATRFNGKGYINEYQYTPDDTLNYKHFPKMTEEWLDFIAAGRAGKSHSYDIVEGPMADDEVYDHVEEFLSGKISRKAFWELVKFKKPTHQISFHTARALETLKFVKAYEVKDEH